MGMKSRGKRMGCPWFTRALCGEEMPTPKQCLPPPGKCLDFESPGNRFPGVGEK